MDFTRMTKAEIEAHGRAHGIELDRRFAKPKLIAALEAHLAAKSEADPLEPVLAAIADEIAPVTITITDSREAPARVAVNNRWLSLPVGTPTRVPAFVLPVLTAAGIGFKKD